MYNNTIIDRQANYSARGNAGTNDTLYFSIKSEAKPAISDSGVDRHQIFGSNGDRIFATRLCCYHWEVKLPASDALPD